MIFTRNYFYTITHMTICLFIFFVSFAHTPKTS